MWNRLRVCFEFLGFFVEYNQRCIGIGIQVNNYFNEMFEEYGLVRGRVDEEWGEEGMLGEEIIEIRRS